jgi:hypothetical protein
VKGYLPFAAGSGLWSGLLAAIINIAARARIANVESCTEKYLLEVGVGDFTRA